MSDRSISPDQTAAGWSQAMYAGICQTCGELLAVSGRKMETGRLGRHGDIEKKPGPYLGYIVRRKTKLGVSWDVLLEVRINGLFHLYMGVSKNRCTPKWMVYNEKPY